MPHITEINMRTGPGTSFSIACRVPVGLAELPVTAAEVDAEGRGFAGKTYQWLRVTLPDGTVGWVRDDLIEVRGNGRPFGYGVLAVNAFAFMLSRQAAAPSPQPAAPSPQPAPAPAPLPVTPPPQPAPALPEAPASPGPTREACVAHVNIRDGANARSGPGTTFAQVMRAARGVSFTVRRVQREPGGAFLWVNGVIDGQNVWMREDLLWFEGDLAAFGLGANDSYPAPMRARWWVRGFTGPNPADHWGWDYGALTGEPIYSGPQGGLVTHSVECVKCAGGKSFKHFGIRLGDSAALNDPGWNFGYGHYVIVRYLNAHLPQSTRDALAARGLADAHLFCMYAHLDSRAVSAGQVIGPETIIGTCGDTGNSEATHLHLEVRASRGANDSNWASMKPNLLDPVILFRR